MGNPENKVTTMKTIKQWIKDRPFSAITFSIWFTFLSCMMATCAPEPFAVLFVATLVGWVFTVARHGVRLVLLLAVAVPAKAEDRPQQSQAVAIGAAVVVVCVGGYCVYRLAKFCQKKFPKENKDTNSNFSAQSDEYGASWNYAPMGSCHPDDGDFNAFATQGNGTLFRLNVFLHWSGETSVSMTANTSPEATQSFLEFQADVRSHGLEIAGTGDGSQFFSINKVPCDPAQVPIEFDPITRVVSHNNGYQLRRVVIERSTDLINWSSFLTTDASVGTGFAVEDASINGQMFYRVATMERN